jgi:hypothetical protein
MKRNELLQKMVFMGIEENDHDYINFALDKNFHDHNSSTKFVYKAIQKLNYRTVAHLIENGAAIDFSLLSIDALYATSDNPESQQTIQSAIFDLLLSKLNMSELGNSLIKNTLFTTVITNNRLDYLDRLNSVVPMTNVMSRSEFLSVISNVEEIRGLDCLQEAIRHFVSIDMSYELCVAISNAGGISCLYNLLQSNTLTKQTLPFTLYDLNSLSEIEMAIAVFPNVKFISDCINVLASSNEVPNYDSVRTLVERTKYRAPTPNVLFVENLATPIITLISIGYFDSAIQLFEDINKYGYSEKDIDSCLFNLIERLSVTNATLLYSFLSFAYIDQKAKKVLGLDRDTISNTFFFSQLLRASADSQGNFELILDNIKNLPVSSYTTVLRRLKNKSDDTKSITKLLNSHFYVFKAIYNKILIETSESYDDVRKRVIESVFVNKKLPSDSLERCDFFHQFLSTDDDVATAEVYLKIYMLSYDTAIRDLELTKSEKVALAIIKVHPINVVEALAYIKSIKVKEAILKELN